MSAPTAVHQVPTDARRAASLVLLRNAPDTSNAPNARHASDADTGSAVLEVLMLQRAQRSDNDMRSGAAVFPGGALDPRDRDAHAWCLGWHDSHLSAAFQGPEAALDYAVAALRETFEEVGLLLACAADGAPLDVAARQVEFDTWRQRLQRAEVGMADFCRHFDLRLDLRGLSYSGHWLTPPGMPKRFDTRFFTALAPTLQVPTPDLGEALSLMWITPAAALAPASGLKLLPAMRRMLNDLLPFSDAASALAAVQQRPAVRLTMPRMGATREGLRVVLPDDLAWAEIGRLDPAGRHDVSCELLPGRAVRLSANVWRITAPNPGPMTGPGTNSYLVGAGAAWTVIDPGPADPAHLQALQTAAQTAAQASGGRITCILVTHTHRDHSPGAAPLSAATGAPVWGRVAAHPEWQDTSFSPNRELQHGERLSLAPSVNLRVLHTPGHASNHLCYLLEEERLLFTGDHVMQGSTVVINPPDGDMAVYLQSLRSLLDEDLEWLAPGHGFLVAEPHAVLRGLIAHRLKREGKVLQALQAAGTALLDDLLPRVYGDVSPVLYPVARRSLLAHLLKLQDDGRARAADAGDGWSAVD